MCVYILQLSTVNSICDVVICFNLITLLVNIIKLCKPLRKLDIPKLCHGSIEERTPIEQIKKLTPLGFDIYMYIYKCN